MSDELDLTLQAEDRLLESDSDTYSDRESTVLDNKAATRPSTLEKDITEISRSAAKLDIVNKAATRPSTLDKDLSEISRSAAKLNIVYTPKGSKVKRPREPSEEDNHNNSSLSNKEPPIKKVKKVTMAPPPVVDPVQQQKFLIRLVPDIEDTHLFSEVHLNMLHSSVLKELKGCKNPNIKFDFCQPERGRYKFVCPNVDSKEFALNIVPLLKNLWADPKIKAVDFGSVPRLIRATVTFNNPAPETLDFFEDLDLKNDNLDTNDWRIYGRKKVKGNKTVFFLGIDEKSVEDLKAVSYRPYFVNGRIKFTIDNSNQNN